MKNFKISNMHRAITREDKVVVQLLFLPRVFDDQNPHPDFMSNQSDESCEGNGLQVDPK